jgi:phage protein D
LIAFSVLADLARQRTSLTVSGWDVAGKEGIAHTATATAIRGELNGHDSGGSVLERAFGERAEQMVHLVPLTAEEARALAESAYRKMARRFLSGHGVCQGDGRLRVGATVTLAGLGALFDGEYYVTEVRHTFNGQDGYQTYFRVERPGLGAGY